MLALRQLKRCAVIPDVDKASGTAIDLEVQRPGLKLRSRYGYAAGGVNREGEA
jgi:hypothetical protein